MRRFFCSVVVSNSSTAIWKSCGSTLAISWRVTAAYLDVGAKHVESVAFVMHAASDLGAGALD
jgi:hypothetical protein